MGRDALDRRNDQAVAALLRDLRAQVLDLRELLEAAREPHHGAELARRLEHAEKTLNRVGNQ